MSWLQLVPAVLVAISILYVPGAIVARVIGARGITWLGLSAPISLSLVAVSAMAGQLAGIKWSPLTLIVATLIAAVIAFAVRYVVELRRQEDKKPLWEIPRPALIVGFIGALIIGTGILGVRLMSGAIAPENISQTYDNVFHLNAVRYILDTGNASSLALANLGQNGAGGFYPGVWHSVVALIVQLSGVSIPAATNAAMLAVSIFVWLTSTFYLTTRATGSRPAAYLLAAGLSGAFLAFPYLLVGFGVLYPNLLGIAIIPAALAIFADLLRLSKSPTLGPVRALVLGVLVLPALALSHPNSLLAFAAFALVVAIFWLLKLVKSTIQGQVKWYWLVTAIAAVGIYWFALSKVWETYRPSKKASFWPTFQTTPQALGEAIFNAPMGRQISWTLVVLTLLGAYALVRQRKHVWVLGIFATAIFFYLVSSSWADATQRDFYSGVFYNDSFRLAALLPLAAVVIAVVGCLWVFDSLLAWSKIKAESPKRALLIAMSIGTLAALGVIYFGQSEAVRYEVRKIRSSYDVNAQNNLLSADEALLLSRIDKLVPADATVIANPATGASLIYALDGREVILPAVGSRASKEDLVLTTRLDALKTDPEVCKAVKSANAFYILDFGSQTINQTRIAFPTSEQLAANSSLQLLDSQGAAKLYRIEACGK